MRTQSVGDPVVCAQTRFKVAPLAAELAEDLLVGDPRYQEMSAFTIELAIALVTNNEPLTGVVHHQARIEALDRIH
jgi:hypothetical protein